MPDKNKIRLIKEYALQSAVSAIVLTDPDGIILYVNQAFLDLLKYPVDKFIVGKSIVNFSCNKHNTTQFLGSVKNNSSCKCEWQLFCREGELIDVLITANQVKNNDGLFLGLMLIFNDISDRKATERKIKESEELRESYLSSVINNHPGMFWMKDLEGRFVLSNIQNNDFLRLFNTNIISAIGLTDFDICDKEFAMRFLEEDKHVIETRQPLLIEEPIKTPTGEIWFEKVKFPVTDKNGEIIGVSGYSIDISERKKEQSQLLMQSTAFESFSLAVLITDRNGYIQWANPAFAQLTGYSIEESIGKKPNILKSGLLDKHFVAEFWKTIVAGNVWSGEFINRKKDGTVYYEENTITPVRNTEGKISHFIAIKTDVTQRKEMEKALRSSEERWQFALEGTGDGVWDWVITTDNAFFSTQWKNMLGYSQEEIGTKVQEWKKRIHRNDLSEWNKALNNHLNKLEPLFINEHRLLCKDGSYKWVLARGRVVEWSLSGKAHRIIGTITDISEQKIVEETLILGIEKERELNEMKSRFVSMASHEFRTPLASILITDETLIAYWNKMTQEQINTKLEKIKEKVMHLNKIVNDVLQISKIQEGKTDFNPEIVEIVKYCNDAIEDFNNNNASNINIEFSSCIPSLKMMLDTRLFSQILNNLISNAIKYSPADSSVHFDIREDDLFIFIDIKDSGIGIPLSDQKHLFSPFFRASNARLIQGNGLGLNIVKESVLAHGGEIEFESNTNSGTTFTIKLPKKLIV